MCCVYMQLGAEGKGRRLEEGEGGGCNDKTDGPLGGEYLDIPSSDHCPSCLIQPLQTHTVHQSDSVSFIQLSTSQDTLCFIQHCLLHTTVCLIQQIASYNRLLHTTDCFIQQSASYNSLPHTTVFLIQVCFIQQTALYNSLLHTTDCLIQQSALYNKSASYNSLPHTTVRLIQQSTSYSRHTLHSIQQRWSYRCAGVKEMVLQMCWGQGDGLTDVLGLRRWSYRCAGVKRDGLTDVLGSKEMVLQMCWG